MKRKRILMLALVLGGVFCMYNCENNFTEEIGEIEETKKEVLSKGEKVKKIYYEGFEVNHRFKATEEELKEKHTKKYLEKLFKKLKKKHQKEGKEKNSIAPAPEEIIILPSPEAILAASKIVLINFPYERIDDYNLVGLQSENGTDVDMITNDFDNITEQDIDSNNEVLDEYYSQNLDYEVLEEIAMHPEIYDSLNNNKTYSKGEFFTYLCTMWEAVRQGYGLVRSTISYALAADQANTSSSNYFSGLPEGDSRRDAYRHILWNSLLAQYYFTISSKSPRLGFAKVITDRREAYFCGSRNEDDSEAMDFHNNSIGRRIWDENTTYRRFFGWIVALNRTSVSNLKDLALHKVKKKSCFIVKNHPDEAQFNYNMEEVETEILKIYENTAVYFRGLIAPKLKVTTVEYKNVPCDDSLPIVGESPNITNEDGTDANVPCYVPIYSTAQINACFISKDPNFNPYN